MGTSRSTLSPTTLSVAAARRFVLRTQHLDTPFPNVDTALAYLGYIQIDPLNICGRMHDLILRNRVTNYREGDLMRHVHGGDQIDTAIEPAPKDARSRYRAAEERTAFEHHLPDTNVLVVFPLEAWPHLRAAMRARTRRISAWSGRLTPTERRLAPELLAEIGRRGPMSSQDFADDRRARRTVWGKSSLVKSVLQKLFFHGELLIAARVQNRRTYDLPEKVIPAAIRQQPDASEAETARWLALLKLRQRRLALLKRAELPLVEDAVQPVAIEGCPMTYCLAEDLSQVAAAAADMPAGDGGLHLTPRLLAPLDPMIYDRRLTAALWNFDYTWEAYTPAAKRVRGHYALPVLDGLELAGHVEPKADRAHRKLLVASRSVRRGTRVAPALDELAAWLGLRR
jgi:uncharacterized protein YcaQ